MRLSCGRIFQRQSRCGNFSAVYVCDSIRSRPYERPVPPGRPLSLFPSRINALLAWKRPERRRSIRSRSGPVCLCLCSEGLRRGRDRFARTETIQPLPWGKFSAGAAPGDSSPADAGACESAVRAVAARCGAGRRNCCKSPAARPARGASGRARDIPESNTAPSIRADIASLSLAVRVNRMFRR